jgi:ABC-type Fe3+ transport system permease subunit
MSSAGFLGPTPFHSFYHTPFTSNVTSDFNIWPVILTAALFFTVLSWYNALFALYEYYFKGQTDEENTRLRNNLWTTLVIAFIWTIIAICLYFWLSNMGWLTKEKISDVGDEIQPTAGPESISEALPL